MKKILLIKLLFLLPFLGSAQESVLLGSSKTFVISLNAGVSVPEGKYKNHDRFDTSSGYAKPGVNYNIAFSWKFLDNIGIAGAAGGMTHSLLVNSGDKFFYSTKSPIVWNSLENFYSMQYYMAGLFFNDWAGDDSRFSMNARALYGRIIMDLPALSVNGRSEKEALALTMNSASTKSYGFLFGLGGRLILTKNISLIANVDYIFATCDFGKREYYISEYGISKTESINLKLPINIFNYSMGLGFMF